MAKKGKNLKQKQKKKISLDEIDIEKINLDELDLDNIDVDDQDDFDNDISMDDLMSDDLENDPLMNEISSLLGEKKAKSPKNNENSKKITKISQNTPNKQNIKTNDDLIAEKESPPNSVQNQSEIIRQLKLLNETNSKILYILSEVHKISVFPDNIQSGPPLDRVLPRKSPDATQISLIENHVGRILIQKLKMNPIVLYEDILKELPKKYGLDNQSLIKILKKITKKHDLSVDFEEETLNYVRRRIRSK